MRGGRTSASSSMGRREATGKRNGQRRRRAVEAAAGQTVGARLARGACSAVVPPAGSASGQWPHARTPFDPVKHGSKILLETR